MQNKLQKQFLTRISLDLPLELFILPSLHSPTGLLTQQEYPIEWIYTHFRETRSLTSYLDLITLIIINGRNRAKTLTGSYPHKIVISINKFQFENALQTYSDFQIASLEYFREISFHYPSNKLWNFLKILNLLSLTLSHHDLYLSSVQFSSVTQSCPTLFDPMNCSTPGLPVHHQLLKFTQTHVHPVGDAIQPSHPLLSPSPPTPNPSQHQSLFQ